MESSRHDLAKGTAGRGLIQQSITSFERGFFFHLFVLFHLVPIFYGFIGGEYTLCGSIVIGIGWRRKLLTERLRKEYETGSTFPQVYQGILECFYSNNDWEISSWGLQYRCIKLYSQKTTEKYAGAFTLAMIMAILFGGSKAEPCTEDGSIFTRRTILCETDRLQARYFPGYNSGGHDSTHNVQYSRCFMKGPTYGVKVVIMIMYIKMKSAWKDNWLSCWRLI